VGRWAIFCAMNNEEVYFFSALSMIIQSN
jgi:hypothetical protein